MSVEQHGYLLTRVENNGRGNPDNFMEAHEEAELRYRAEKCGLCNDEFERAVYGNGIRLGGTSSPGDVLSVNRAAQLITAKRPSSFLLAK